MRLQVILMAAVGLAGGCADKAHAQEPEAPLALATSGLAQSAIADPVGAEREIAELQAMLKDWIDRPDWPHLPDKQGQGDGHSENLTGDPCPAISSRLALFQTRFAMGFRDVPVWAEFAELARHASDRLIAEYPAPEPNATAFGAAWIAPGWVAVRALLLDVAGETNDAKELLFGELDRYWDGCCYPCLSQDLFYVSRARAEYLDRAGDNEGALRWMHEAYYRCYQDDFADMFGRARPARDIFLARYAILLADAGESEAAAGIVKVLEADGAESLGLSVTRSKLGTSLSGVSGSSVFVNVTPVSRPPEWERPEAWAYIVGDPSDDSTWRVLAYAVHRFPRGGLGID